MPTGIYIRTEKHKKNWFKKGQLNILNDPIIKKKMIEAKTGMKYEPFSEEHKRNIGKANKGKKHTKEYSDMCSYMAKTGIIGMKGKKHTEGTKEKMRQWHIENPNRKFKDTSIELKVEAELIRRGINYQKQVPLCKIAIVDFYLPEYRIIIQADGDYYHRFPEHIKKDKYQDLILTFNGFNVYRFWGKEINKNISSCINKLKLKT